MNQVNMFSKRPNFLFIGPDKSGSTWLYEIFSQHPACFVPKIKDIYFFDRFYNRGLGWYLSFFESSSSKDIAIGELSHDYLFSEQAAKRIKYHFPDMKLITILRNPIHKIWSQYLYLQRSGITKKDFNSALQEIPELLEKSFYSKYLQTYLDIFERRQIKIMIFDDFKDDKIDFANNIFIFLGLKFIPDLDYNRRVLAASRARNYYLSRIVKIGAELTRQMGYENLLGRIKSNKNINTLLYKKYSKKPENNRDTNLYLKNIFQEDVKKTSYLINRDLTFWLKDL